MEMRTIGGLSVSLVGLGCNNFGGRASEEASVAVIHAALDEGITFLDTSDSYAATKSEEIIGRVLGGRRDEVVLATKFASKLEKEGSGGGSARWVREAVEDSLRRLQTDVIDLYQQHFPDPEVPIEETLGALNELVVAGKVRFIGCSNFSGPMVDEAAAVAERNGWSAFVSAQNNFSLLQQEGIIDDVLPACERHGLAMLPWFPLAAGLLTGKYQRGVEAPPGTRLAGAKGSYFESIVSDENFVRVERLEKWAAERGHSILELAFAWLAAFPQVASVIAGATRPEQVKANVAAVSWKLTPAERDEVGALVR